MQKFNLFENGLITLNQFLHHAAQLLSLAVLDGLYKLISKEESEVAAVHIGLSTNGLQERCFLLVVSLHKQYVLDLFEKCVDLIRTLLTTF